MLLKRYNQYRKVREKFASQTKFDLINYFANTHDLLCAAFLSRDRYGEGVGPRESKVHQGCQVRIDRGC